MVACIVIAITMTNKKGVLYNGKTIALGVRSVSSHLLMCHLGQGANLSEHPIEGS